MPSLREPAFPIVVSGPSGVGKTVLCERLLDTLSWTRRSVSATTRSSRAQEKNGEAYFFYTREQFEEERGAGRLVEWAEVHEELYGTPRDFVDRQIESGYSVVLNIDVQGGLSIRQAYPDALLVFVLPPSFEVLEQRLRDRDTDSEAQIRARLEVAAREIRVLPEYDHVVINGDLVRAADELIAIVAAERSRVSRRQPQFDGDAVGGRS